MKFALKRTIVFALLICVISSSIILNTTAAADQDARFTKKIVSVLYDNSGSMDNERNLYALYSIQTLMSLLNAEDTLLIVPMNGSNVAEIDLSTSDRNAQVEKALKETFLSNTPSGGTPPQSMEKARKELEKRGLKTKQELLQEDNTCEYWLVILTDGAFNGVTKGDVEDTSSCVEGYISQYPSLNTIYLGFVDAVDLSGSSLTSKYKFSPYIAKDVDSIVDAMQKIANLLSGRFTMPKETFSVSGSTVTVDLNKYEYALKSISIIAQNCGAEIESAVYNTNDMKVSQPCILRPNKNLGIATGYSGVIKGDPYFNGGTVTITFSAPIAEENLAILAEPALNMTSYIECKDGNSFKRVDIQYVNENLRQGDIIRIGYEITEMANGTPIDISKIFGETKTKVIYAGNSYECGQEFPLVLGTNDIGVTVSVMDGKFVMHDSIKCVIEQDPSYFRIEAAFSDNLNSTAKVLKSVYTVFANNAPLTKLELEAYGISITTTNSDGTEIAATYVIGNDGKIIVSSDISSGGFGVYNEYIKVTSPIGTWREHSHSVNFYPSSIDVKLISGDGLSMTEAELANGFGEIKFELTADGLPLSFDSGIIDYKLMFADADVASFATVEGNVLTYVPRTIDTGKGALTPGQIAITLTASLKNDQAVTDSAEVKFTLNPSVYELQVIQSPDKKIDRFLINANDAVLYFNILRDGDTMSAAELEALYKDGKIKLDGKGMFTNPLLPCASAVTSEIYDGVGVIAVRTERDQAKLFACFTSMFLFNNKEVTFTYGNNTVSDSFDFTSSNVWSYIWRILVIIAIIHVILWAVGFAFRKNFPAGALVGVSLAGRTTGNVSSTAIPINDRLIDRLKIHLLGFIPGNYFCVQNLQEITICGVTLKPDFISDPALGRTTKFTIVSLPHGAAGLESCIVNSSSPKRPDYSALITNVRSGNVDYSLNLQIQQWRNLFIYHGNMKPLQVDHCMPLSGCYAIVNPSTRKIERVIVFVKFD